MLQLRADRQLFRPFGLAGGGEAAPTHNVLNPDTASTALPGKVTTTLRRGDVIRHEQSGGGGHGDPLERALDALGRDLADGKITPGFAARHHGVAFDAAGDVDAAATARRRALLRAAAGEPG